jgi:hypothetical protein
MVAIPTTSYNNFIQKGDLDVEAIKANGEIDGSEHQ